MTFSFPAASVLSISMLLASPLAAQISVTGGGDVGYCQVVELRASLLSHRFLSGHFCSVILP